MEKVIVVGVIIVNIFDIVGYIIFVEFGGLIWGIKENVLNID